MSKSWAQQIAEDNLVAGTTMVNEYTPGGGPYHDTVAAKRAWEQLDEGQRLAVVTRASSRTLGKHTVSNGTYRGGGNKGNLALNLALITALGFALFIVALAMMGAS